MPEACLVASVGERPYLRAADIGDFCAFIGLIDGRIPGSKHVPVISGYGAIFFGAHLAVVSSGFIPAAIEAAFIVEKLHRLVDRPFSQDGGEADKGSGISKPGQSPKP